MGKTNPFWFFSISLLVLSTPSGAQTQTAISNFGSNPGNINAYQYVPANMPANAPLVVVLHGCTQTAASYGNETAWNTLADNQKFYVAYAEQTSSNNSLECFNYYVESDINRGQGEALSIKQITDYMKANYSIDSTRVFVTGLSAGGAMTCVMCSAYPDIFAAGAEMSGLAYKIAIGQIDADLACVTAPSGTAQQRGDSARAQMPGYTGNWPRMAIFHGTSDAVVNNSNATEVIKQFTNLHGCGQTPGYANSSFNANSIIQLQQYFDSNNRVAVAYYSISNMSHGTAVYPGTCYQQGGNTDALAFNETFYSPFWAAQFFGILQLPYSMTGLTNITINQQGLTYSVPNTAGSVYTWTVPPGVTIVSGQGTNSVTVNWDSLNGAISVTEMPTGGCEQGPVQLFVTVSPVQQQALDAGVNSITDPAGTICAATFTPSFTLTNAGTTTLTSVSIYYAVDNNTPQNYNWIGSLATSQSTTVTLPALNVSAGNHVLKIFCSSPNGGTDGNLSNDTVIKNFTLASPPVVNLGGSIVQCGGSVVINAQNTGDSYAWSTGAASQTVSVSQGGTYTVTVTGGSCTASASVNVTIIPLPVINLTGSSTCASQLTLDAGNSGATFNWSTNATTESITATSSGTYSVTVTNTQNCSASASVNVNLNTAPVVNLGSGGSVCGTQFPLDAGNTGASYQWNTGATTQTINASASGTYSVTVTSGGCSASGSVNVSINAVPVVNLTGGNTCASQLTLDAGNSGSSFNWNTNATTQTINVTNSGNYSVTVTSTQNCSASASANVSLNTAPVVNLGTGGSVCGNQFPLDAGNPGSSFLWSTGATTEAINATATGTYSVTVTGGANCSASASVSVIVNPPPLVSLQFPEDTFCSTSGLITLQGESPAGGTFTGDDVTGGAFDASAAGAGIYPVTYSYTDNNGCTSSASQNLVVRSCTSIITPGENIEVIFFPNPNFSGTMFIHVGGPMTGLQAKIFDAIGSLVSEKYVDTENSQLNIAGLSPGIYVISFEGPGITLRKKFVVQ